MLRIHIRDIYDIVQYVVIHVLDVAEQDDAYAVHIDILSIALHVQCVRRIG